MAFNIGEVYQTSPPNTNFQSYFEPLRADLEWWDLEHLELLHTFSSWNPAGIGVSNHVNVVEINVTPPGTSQYGSFYFKIYDTEKVIEQRDLRRKSIIVIKVKKYQSDPYENLIYGFTSKLRPQRKANQLFYTISGLGSGILLNERFINIRRSARMQAIDSDTPLFNDATMEIRRLFKEMLTQKELYVYDDIAIADQTNPPMDTSGLDQNVVNDTILSLNEPYVQASHALNAMLDSVGADGGIDAYNKPYLTYPLSQTPSLTIKIWNEDAEAGKDLPINTSYFMEDWDYEMDYSQESGFANRLFAKGKVTQGTSTASTTGAYSGFETLQDMNLAQKIPASPAKFKDLAVIVNRVGEGTINPNTKTLHGHIVQDNNNSPTGPIVALFDIPLANIPEDNPTAMFLSNMTFKRAVDPGLSHWVILYERGNPGTPDTINWYYNTTEALDGTIARRPDIVGTPWKNNHDSNSGWEVTTNNSFNFAFSVLDSSTVPLVSEDVDSQIRYGIVEDFVDVSWTSNIIAANKALGEILAIRCLPKITYFTNAVTIPNRLFMPGLIVRMEDVLSGLLPGQGNFAEITNATYSFGGGSGNPLGALTCDINLVGHYDFKLEDEITSIGSES